MTCVNVLAESTCQVPPTLPGDQIGVLCLLAVRAGQEGAGFEAAWRAARRDLAPLRVTRYAQLLIEPPPPAPAGSPELPITVDAMEEFWLQDGEALARFAEPANLARLFGPLPLAALTLLRFREAPVVDALEPGAPTETMVKRMVALVRKPPMTHEEFQRHWIEVHQPLARAAAGRHSRYHQLHVDAHIANPAGLPDHGVRIDGLSESWFEDGKALLAGAGTDAGRALIADNTRYVQASRKLFFRERDFAASLHRQPVTPPSP